MLCDAKNKCIYVPGNTQVIIDVLEKYDNQISNIYDLHNTP